MMDNIIYMDNGEKSSDGVVKYLETYEDFAREGYIVERTELRALKCPCGKWYHSLADGCPVCGTGNDKAVEKMRVADFSDKQGKWAIEKKLDTNLWSSLVNREIYEQGEKMGAVYGNGGCIAMQGFMSILVENHPDKANWIWSIVAKAPVLWGVGFAVVEDDLGMARLIHSYIQQSRHDEIERRFKVDSVRNESERLASVRAVKGIGDAIGIKALSHFGSIQAIANADKILLEPVFHSKSQAIYDHYHGDAKQEMLDLAEERRKRKEEKDRAKKYHH